MQTFTSKRPHSLYNTEKGSCIVVGNGPSLLDIPHELLTSFPLWGCNDIFLYPLVTKKTIQLRGYSNIGNTHFMDRKHIKELEQAGAMSDMMFLNSEVLAEYPDLLDVLTCPVYPIIGSPYRDTGSHGTVFPRAHFSLTPLHYVGVGYTQTYVNLQLVYALGYTTVYLVGIDNEYGLPDRHFYSEYLSTKELEERDLMDSLSYRRGADAVYDLSRQVYEADGRHIYNLSTRKTTEVFDKLDYRSILE